MSIECDILAKIQNLISVCEVLLQLLVARESLREVPGVVDLGNVELIERHFAVDAGARVAVPEPGTSEVFTLLETLHA